MNRLLSNLSPFIKSMIAGFLDSIIVAGALSFTQILVFDSIQTSVLSIALICLCSIFSFALLGIYNEVSSEADTSITLTKMIMGCLIAHLVLIWQITNSDAIIIGSTSLSCILLVSYRSLLRAHLNLYNIEDD